VAHGFDDTLAHVKPAPFEYFRPATVNEAVSILGDVEDAKVLAGGQSLVPAMNFRLARPAALVDINQIQGLDRIAPEAGWLTIGALARHRTFETPVVGGPLGSLLASAASFVGHLPIRVRGTFAGSLAHADPASEWCVIARTLGAELVASGRDGERTIAADDFFHTVFTTDLRPGELLTTVRLPLLDSSYRVGFAEFSRRAGDFALVMATAVIKIEGGIISQARIGIGGAADRPLRVSQAERALIGTAASSESLTEAADLAAAEVDPLADIHASSDYRRDLVWAMTKRALLQAFTQQPAS
jgi:carbon-monoxide dehydrogenase medium subunit